MFHTFLLPQTADDYKAFKKNSKDHECKSYAAKRWTFWEHRVKFDNGRRIFITSANKWVDRQTKGLLTSSFKTIFKKLAHILAMSYWHNLK